MTDNAPCMDRHSFNRMQSSHRRKKLDSWTYSRPVDDSDSCICGNSNINYELHAKNRALSSINKSKEKSDTMIRSSMVTCVRTMVTTSNLRPVAYPARNNPCCFFSRATSPLQMPLDEFRDVLSPEKRLQEPTGRAWSARELRRKSYTDLHKLWYVLYKEKNMLMTEYHLARRRQRIMPQSGRLQKVKKGMGAIKQVLGERKREKIALFQQTLLDRKNNAEEDQESMEEDEEEGMLQEAPEEEIVKVEK